MAQQNYEREMKGDAPESISLHRVFYGNPGTGKSTVSRLYGALLKELGLLSKGDFIAVRLHAYTPSSSRALILRNSARRSCTSISVSCQFNSRQACVSRGRRVAGVTGHKRRRERERGREKNPFRVHACIHVGRQIDRMRMDGVSARERVRAFSFIAFLTMAAGSISMTCTFWMK